jgi:hypothetical protein
MRRPRAPSPNRSPKINTRRQIAPVKPANDICFVAVGLARASQPRPTRKVNDSCASPSRTIFSRFLQSRSRHGEREPLRAELSPCCYDEAPQFNLTLPRSVPRTARTDRQFSFGYGEERLWRFSRRRKTWERHLFRPVTVNTSVVLCLK